MSPSLGNQRSKRPINQSARQYTMIRCSPIALVGRPRRHTRTAESLLAFDREWHKINLVLGIKIASGSGIDHGFASRQGDGACCETTNLACLYNNGRGVANVHRQGVGSNPVIRCDYGECGGLLYFGYSTYQTSGRSQCRICRRSVYTQPDR